MCLGGGGQGQLQLVGHRNVAGQKEGAVASRRLHHVTEWRRVRTLAERYLRALPQKGLGQRGPDARAAAGHKDRLAAQVGECGVGHSFRPSTTHIVAGQATGKRMPRVIKARPVSVKGADFSAFGPRDWRGASSGLISVTV